MNVAPKTEPEPNQELMRYLYEYDAYLQKNVPDAERENLIEEAYDHLSSTIEMLEETCISRETATILALESYGTARANAEEVIDSWFNKQPQHQSLLIRKIGLANAYAFGLFGCADLTYWILQQVRVFLPSSAPFNMPWTPAQARVYFPDPLPFPDFSISFLITMGFPIVIPFILGWMCGRYIPVRSKQYVYNAMMPIIVTSYLIGVLLLPITEGLVFAIFQTLFWLPVGCLTAHLSSSLLWRSRQRAIGRADSARPPFSTKHRR